MGGEEKKEGGYLGMGDIGQRIGGMGASKQIGTSLAGKPRVRVLT